MRVVSNFIKQRLPVANSMVSTVFLCGQHFLGLKWLCLCYLAGRGSYPDRASLH